MLTLSLSLLAAGCKAQRRPETPVPTPPGDTTPPSGVGEATRDMAAAISSAIASMGLPDVRSTHSVVLSNVAIVGLDRSGAAGGGTPGGGTPGTTPPTSVAPGAGGPGLPGGTTGGTAAPGAGAQSTERTVGDRVRTMFPQVVEVYVTSDPARVTELARIADDVRRGIPITTHMERLSSLLKGMTPTVRAGAGGGVTPGAPGTPGTPGGTTPAPAPGSPGGTTTTSR